MWADITIVIVRVDFHYHFFELSIGVSGYVA